MNKMECLTTNAVFYFPSLFPEKVVEQFGNKSDGKIKAVAKIAFAYMVLTGTFLGAVTITLGLQVGVMTMCTLLFISRLGSLKASKPYQDSQTSQMSGEAINHLLITQGPDITQRGVADRQEKQNKIALVEKWISHIERRIRFVENTLSYQSSTQYCSCEDVRDGYRLKEYLRFWVDFEGDEPVETFMKKVEQYLTRIDQITINNDNWFRCLKPKDIAPVQGEHVKKEKGGQALTDELHYCKKIGEEWTTLLKEAVANIKKTTPQSALIADIENFIMKIDKWRRIGSIEGYELLLPRVRQFVGVAWGEQKDC